MTSRSNKKRAFVGLGRPKKPAEAKPDIPEDQARAIEDVVEAKGRAVAGNDTPVTDSNEKKPRKHIAEDGPANSKYYKRKGRITKEGRKGGGDVLEKMNFMVPEQLAKSLRLHCVEAKISLSEGVARALSAYLDSSTE